MPWSNKATLTGLGTALSETTNVDDDYTATNHFTQWVTLNPLSTDKLQIEVTFGSTGNDIYYRPVCTLDATAENADTVGLPGGSVPFVANTTQRRTFFITGVYKYRIEVRKGGTTAGSYTPNVHYRNNGINV